MKYITKIMQASLLVFCCIAAVIHSSCNMGNHYPKEVLSLDSLSVQLHKADSTLRFVDTARILKYSDHIMVTLEFIQMAHKDTMSAGAAAIFRNFNALRWSMQTFIGKRNVLRVEMNKSVANISHLSHDLQNGLIKSDSVSFYFDFEVKRANELVETVRFAINDVSNQIPLYILIAPQADSLISRIKNKQSL